MQKLLLWEWLSFRFALAVILSFLCILTFTLFMHSRVLRLCHVPEATQPRRRATAGLLFHGLLSGSLERVRWGWGAAGCSPPSLHSGGVVLCPHLAFLYSAFCRLYQLL